MNDCVDNHYKLECMQQLLNMIYHYTGGNKQFSYIPMKTVFIKSYNSSLSIIYMRWIAWLPFLGVFREAVFETDHFHNEILSKYVIDIVVEKVS